MQESRLKADKLTGRREAEEGVSELDLRLEVTRLNERTQTKHTEPPGPLGYHRRSPRVTKSQKEGGGWAQIKEQWLKLPKPGKSEAYRVKKLRKY